MVANHHNRLVQEVPSNHHQYQLYKYFQLKTDWNHHTYHQFQLDNFKALNNFMTELSKSYKNL